MPRPSTPAVVVHRSPDEPVLDHAAVHLWLCDLDHDADKLLAGAPVLSPDEQARASRPERPQLARRYVARCVLVRHVLGRLVGVAPAAVEFSLGPFGKPALAPGGAAPRAPGDAERPRLNFNLSHSENVLALAVSFQREVGVDVECVRHDFDYLQLANDQFAPVVVRHLRRLPPSERAVAFYRAWTRREALAKAAGRGPASPANNAPTGTPGGNRDLPTTIHSYECTVGSAFAVGSLALGAG